VELQHRHIVVSSAGETVRTPLLIVSDRTLMPANQAQKKLPANARIVGIN
jgi:hypothetical protein